MDAANRAYDRSLTASLKSIAENIHATGGHISVDIPYSWRWISSKRVSRSTSITPFSARAAYLTGYDDLHPPHWRVGGEPPAMVILYFREQSIRMGTLVKRLYDPELKGGDAVTILFAETTEARTRLAFSLFMESLRPPWC